jgi:DNA modification methylase
MDRQAHLPTDTIITGDALAEIQKLPDGSIDLILCDLPYGTTDCAWDKVIPIEALWAEYKRITKLNAAILLFAQQPFATKLINAAGRLFRYQVVWEKAKALGFLNARRMPLRVHELILVFYRRLPTYNPQLTPGKPYAAKDRRRGRVSVYTARGTGKHPPASGKWRYPKDIVRFAQPSPSEGQHHPTQKPLALLEYLIRTYSNSGDLVLDNACGSGSTCVTAIRADRRYIGIELDETFADIARMRCAAAKEGPPCES